VIRVAVPVIRALSGDARTPVIVDLDLDESAG